MNMTSCVAVEEYHAPEDTYTSSDIAKAFMMVMIAGVCTSVGVVIVFCVSDDTDANGNYDTTILGYSLAIAAGVMMYISLTTLYLEAVETFKNVYEDNGELARFVSFCSLVVGVLIGQGIDLFVQYISGEESHSHAEDI